MRDPAEILAEEFVKRYRRGENPSLTEYTERRPDLAEEIRELFPAMLVMEQIGQPSTLNERGDEKGKGGASAMRQPPSQLGEYRILREIGRGGMGVVFEADQPALGRRVALKVLPFHGLMAPDAMRRFHREAKAAAALNHPHIVPVFGVGQHEGIHFYAMQFIRGQGLDHVLDQLRTLRQGSTVGRLAPTMSMGDAALPAPPQSDSPGDPRPPSDAAPDTSGSSLLSSHSGTSQSYRGIARIGVQIAQGLAHAHQQGVLHRDIKPSNILLDAEGSAWITDFGLAKSIAGSEDDDLTHSGDIVGTLRYMAPERLRGWSDPRSDIYGVGLTLYEMLTLRWAMDAMDRGGLTEQVLHTDPPPPRKFDRRIPRDLETIVLKAIAKEPAHRYTDAAEMAADLERFLNEKPIFARRTSAFERSWMWARRNPALATALSMLLLVLAGGLAIVTSLYLTADFHRTQAEYQKGVALQRALDEETQRKIAEAQRKVALAKARQAREAVDRFFSVVSQERQLQAKGMEKFRQRLLEQANQFYATFLSEQPDDPALLAEYGRTAYRLGKIHSELGQHERGRELVELALAQTEAGRAAAAITPDDRAQWRSFFAEELMFTGRDEEAAAQFDIAISLRRKLLAAHPDAELFIGLLGRDLVNYARFALHGENLEQAEALAKEAMALWRKLDCLPPNHSDYDDEVGNCLLCLANVQAAKMQLDQARQTAQTALDHYAEAARASPHEHLYYRRSVADAHKLLGLIESQSHRFLQAEKRYQEAADRFASLAEAHPQAPLYRRDLASTNYRLGFVQFMTGRTDEAEKTLNDNVQRIDELIAKHPEELALLQTQGHCFNVLYGVYQRQKRRELEKESIEKSIAVFQRLHDRSPERVGAAVDLGSTLGNLGNHYLRSGKFHQSLPPYAKSLAMLEEAVSSEPNNVRALGFLINTSLNAATAHLHLKQFERALPHWDRVEQLDRRGHAAFDVALGRIDAAIGLRRYKQAATQIKDFTDAHGAVKDGYYRAARRAAAAVTAARADEKLAAAEKQQWTKQFTDLAVETLQQAKADAFFDNDQNLEKLKSDHSFDSLRNEPIFEQLLK